MDMANCCWVLMQQCEWLTTVCGSTTVCANTELLKLRLVFATNNDQHFSGLLHDSPDGPTLTFYSYAKRAIRKGKFGKVSFEFGLPKPLDEISD